MAFDEELRSFLRGIERAAGREPARRRRVDEAALRRHLLDRLRGLEHQPRRVRDLFEAWSPRTGELARFVEALPPRAAPRAADAALAFTCRLLDHGLALRERGRALVDELEAARLLAAFLQPAELAPYALENRLVRRDPAGALLVTQLGSLFLGLRGEEAIRWLLTIELAGSCGPRDPWRASRELLTQLLARRGISLDVAGAADAAAAIDAPCHPQTLDRLVRLGVVHAGGPRGGRGRAVLAMRDVVRRALDGGAFAPAVAALLDAERPPALQAAGSRVLAEGAAAAASAGATPASLLVRETRRPLIASDLLAAEPRGPGAVRGALRASACSTSALRTLHRRALTEVDPNRKGQLLEELVATLFRATPGFERVQTRLRSDLEEIDIVIENRTDDPLWRSDGAPYLLAECKNWSSPCGAGELGGFCDKLASHYGRTRTGFFIAPGGFTSSFHRAREGKRSAGVLVIPVDAEALALWIGAADRLAVLRELHRRATFGAP